MLRRVRHGVELGAEICKWVGDGLGIGEKIELEWRGNREDIMEGDVDEFEICW